MNSVIENLNNIETNLLTWGNPFNCDGLDVIICVTGNPGITDFYTEFASELHTSLNLPVCVIGHAGHEPVSDKNSNVLRGQEHNFDLNGQIKHKVELLRLIDEKSKFHLIGHSIGCWIILELLNKHSDIVERSKSINLLFPTVQKMALSPNGKFLNKVIRRLHLLVMFFFTFIYLLPAVIKEFLIYNYLKLKSLPLNYKEGMLKFCNPSVGEKILFMAYDEMDKVTSLNVKAVDRMKHVTNVVYGKYDDWVPVRYMEDFKQFQPELIMKEVRIDHAFVLKSSEAVANIVSEYISTKRNN
ncbi:hypothetical protein K1T71_001727 [Dendrolimus kikuchii]|uniref:Uncharacterized protein n=1 Tax=Dendrolimus kikuchii TaxID=765133 RepID=A0ACC1DEI7_9NEOP|nr:hypothetical protein K1T71_001727 [Dendrolimus kikuchii]